VPVPQTDTGRRGENPKVIERTLVKELITRAPENTHLVHVCPFMVQSPNTP